MKLISWTLRDAVRALDLLDKHLDDEIHAMKFYGVALTGKIGIGVIRYRVKPKAKEQRR